MTSSLLLYFFIPLLLTIGAYFLSHSPIIASGVFLLTLIVTIIAIKVTTRQEATKETETHGLLTPANDPSPPTPPDCLLPSKGAVALYFGTSVAYLNESAHHSLFTVKGESLLSLDRSPEGLKITANIYDQNGMVTYLKDNEFNITPSVYQRRERPDKHTLIVYDKWGKRVLYVRYLNPSAIKILGTFWHSTLSHPFVIEEEQFTTPAGIFHAACIEDTNTFIAVQ